MEPYNKIVIYYFSGTGNARNVVMWIADLASAQNIETEVRNIATLRYNKVQPAAKGTLIVFVSPIHGFNYPPIMFHFILRFPKGEGSVVLMNTRAGMLIGKFVTPGLSGCAFWLSALVMKFKGYSIKGMIPVDLPSNWMSLHPSLNDPTVKYLHEKAKEKVGKHGAIVLSGQHDFKALREIVQDLLISPIAVLYYFFGRFFIAKTFYASQLCNNCGVCSQGCPVKAIVTLNHRPYWTFKCESCMRCMSNCPKRAIETGHGFVLAVVLLYGVLMPLIYQGFEKLMIMPHSEVVKFLLETVAALALIGILYPILHYTVRFKFLERLVVYTSLTKFKFWGKRYKALKQ